MKHLFRRGASARTPLFARVRRAMRQASRANQRGAPPVAELVDMASARRTVSRRTFLKASAASVAVAGLTGAGVPVQPPSSSGEPLPRIAILGGGMAGLRAAYILGKARLPCTVYEASNRPRAVVPQPDLPHRHRSGGRRICGLRRKRRVLQGEGGNQRVIEDLQRRAAEGLLHALGRRAG